METLFTFALVFVGIVCFGYLSLLIIFSLGWFTLKKNETGECVFDISVSIVVPFRNEEKNILTLLECLIVQDYPADKTEIILVDDHSEDKSCEIIQQFIEKHKSRNIRLLGLSDKEGFSKKQALTKGIHSATGTLIVTTDADATMTDLWLRTLVNFYVQNRCKIISAPVVLVPQNNVLSKIEALEFLTLIASGAGAINIGFPFLANGANLAFEKNLFKNLDGYSAHDKYASGDDVFLVLQAKKFSKKAKEIFFIKNFNSIVRTRTSLTLKDFINQRTRWASKAVAFHDSFAVLTSLVVFLYSFVILSFLMAGIFYHTLALYAVILWVVKLLFDFPLVFSITKFSKQQNLLWYYIPLQILYPIYVVFVGILSWFYNPTWKGRKIKIKKKKG